MKGKRVSFLAFFIGLSIVGGFIKIPAIITSVALDSFPALLAAAIFGSGAGAIVGGVGHLASALIGGMPMGPLHFVVAIEMALLAALFSVVYRKGKRWTASLLFLIGNGLVAPIPFIFVYGVAFFIGIVPPLLIGSFINVLIGMLLIPRLSAIFKEEFFQGEVNE